MTFDPKCWDLAIAFLEDHPHLDTDGNADELAQLIQHAIEGFIEIKNDNYEPKDTGDAWSGGFADNH